MSKEFIKVEVDRIAVFAANEAYQLEQPHPKGYIWSSPAHRMWRALYAYEWMKANKQESPTAPGYFAIPRSTEIAQVILERELQDDDMGADIEG